MSEREFVAKRRKCRHPNVSIAEKVEVWLHYDFRDGRLDGDSAGKHNPTFHVRVECPDCGLDRELRRPGMYPNWLCEYIEQVNGGGVAHPNPSSPDKRSGGD